MYGLLWGHVRDFIGRLRRSRSPGSCVRYVPLHAWWLTGEPYGTRPRWCDMPRASPITYACDSALRTEQSSQADQIYMYRAKRMTNCWHLSARGFASCANWRHLTLATEWATKFLTRTRELITMYGEVLQVSDQKHFWSNIVDCMQKSGNWSK